MKKMIVIFFIYNFGILSLAKAISVNPVSTQSDGQGASISFNIQNKDSNASNTFLSTESMNLHFEIDVAKSHVGQIGFLYLIAKYNDSWFQRNSVGNWQTWDGKTASLQPYTSKILEKKEIITVLDTQNLPAGEFLVFGGYKNFLEEQLYYNSIPASLLVFDNDTATLHRVKNKSVLTGFFARGLVQNHFAEVVSFSPAAATDSTASNVSQTNLQEMGVDEADRIKTDGNQMYVLETCDSDQSKQCITAYTINAIPATSTPLSQLEIESNNWNQGEFYFSNINGNDHLIHLNNSQTLPTFSVWTQPFFWQNNQTEIKFVDVSQPINMQTTTHISLDTSLLSSRLINNVLYLVTRKNSFFNLPQPEIPLPLLDGVVSETVIKAPTTPENQDIDDLMPVISFNNGSEERLLVQATDCFIPSQNSNKPVDNTIITITAIPLDNPQSHYSTCITGSVDTFYMSTESIYLATSRFPYTVFGNEIIYASEDFEMATEIHKFALGEGVLDYRGSATIPGHLGWNPDKQPFRMGEYKGVLKVATSKGDTFGGNPTTRVSVLREAADSLKLEEIGFLDNLGKPGERLFAARFIENRGYLVTFRRTDPLYVLDFSQPENPLSIGELEIEGYSDYLHPIGENYLLGIGKDAIADSNADRGAWYQGVKLSLFDVSNGQNLREVESIILGKRGTESAVLYDHHALAWLSSGDLATLAIPVQLNEKIVTSFTQDLSHPSTFYDWTQTGLYTFTINTGTNPGISLQGRLITDKASDQCEERIEFCFTAGQYTQNDRAVIQDNSLHYIHNNSVFSAEISNLQ